MSRRAWAALAAAVVVVLLFWAAVSHSVYRETLPVHVLRRAFGEEDGAVAATVLRKLYSIVAFTLLGVVVHAALPRSGRPALRAAVIVAAFSALIEVAQKMRHAHEGQLSNAIDISCGALGGWLAATFARAFGRRDERTEARSAARFAAEERHRANRRPDCDDERVSNDDRR